MLRLLLYFAVGIATGAVAVLLLESTHTKTGRRGRLGPLLWPYAIGLLTGWLVTVDWFAGGITVPFIFMGLGVGIGFAFGLWLVLSRAWYEIGLYRLYHTTDKDRETGDRFVRVVNVLDHLADNPDKTGQVFTNRAIKTFYGTTSSGKAKRTEFYDDKAVLNTPGDTSAKACAVQQFLTELETETTPEQIAATCEKFNLSAEYFQSWLDYGQRPKNPLIPPD